MRVIKKQYLVDFWESRQTKDESRRAQKDLDAWFKAATGPNWVNFGDLKQTFGSTDSVGSCIVFDVGNNRYRLIGRVDYRLHILNVLKIMDHKEYDKQNWIDSCGCNKPTPPRATQSKLRPATRTNKSSSPKKRR